MDAPALLVEPAPLVAPPAVAAEPPSRLLAPPAAEDAPPTPAGLPCLPDCVAAPEPLTAGSPSLLEQDVSAAATLKVVVVTRPS